MVSHQRLAVTADFPVSERPSAPAEGPILPLMSLSSPPYSEPQVSSVRLIFDSIFPVEAPAATEAEEVVEKRPALAEEALTRTRSKDEDKLKTTAVVGRRSARQEVKRTSTTNAHRKRTRPGTSSLTLTTTSSTPSDGRV
ncbi:unnamed protein product [Nesidiocoris tenuis]|uniref:Uncharacterized protein n=1 Tax=Nesidiocoris tenuis TaxID=355587 RepID=A0A6H5H2M5_9HEMI|nr:unnamed protein product [Nesidiocoris tenuis]